MIKHPFKNMMLHGIILLVFNCCFLTLFAEGKANIPIVITTWKFTNSTIKAWEVLKEGRSALDAVERGASVCEEQQCDGTVGYGGSPDENGETTLDALMMDGKTMNVGAVGSLRRIKNAISVARYVLEHTKHSLLVGDLATQFAVKMGFHLETLATPESKAMWKNWFNKEHCQPNFWMNVKPDPRKSCGPYSKLEGNKYDKDVESSKNIGRFNHDTIGLVAIDKNGDIAAGTSTNGAKFKIPGRIGDSPIPGSGAYADNAIGGAAATGDGDVMLRFLPSFLAVEEMRRGSSPEAAARVAVERIVAYYPDFMGAIVALSKDGNHGAACHGITTFPYVVHGNDQDKYKVVDIDCT